MRIIEDVKEERRCKCPHCGCTIGYEEEDVSPMKNGFGIICPKCDENIILEHCCPYEFPKTFYHFGDSQNANHISDEQINQWIKNGLHAMKMNRKNEDGDLWYTGSGDTEIWMYREDADSICVNVAQNYYSASVDYDWIEN